MTRGAILALTALLAATPASATDDCLADAMIVFDGSGSMGEIGFDTGDATRLAEARLAMRLAIPQIAAKRRLGLLVYGPGARGACGNVEVRFPPRADAADAIIGAVEALQPGGLTPLTASVVAAAEVLGYRDTPATVVVVTDGNETCGGTPCATGKRLAAEARDLTVHVIGFRVLVDFWAWDNPEQAAYGTEHPVTKCLADATGGLYVTTETVQDLVEALRQTLGCPVIGRR